MSEHSRLPHSRRSRALGVAVVIALALLAAQAAAAQTPAASAADLAIVHLRAPTVVDDDARTVTVTWIFRATAAIERAEVRWDTDSRPGRDYRFLARGEVADGEPAADEGSTPAFPTYTATFDIPPGASTVYFRVHGATSRHQTWSAERPVAVVTLATTVAGAFPAIVVIQTAPGTGSGFIVNARQILTNWHVVRRASEVTVWFAGSERRTGSVLVVNRHLDVAVVEVPDMPPGVRKVDWESAAKPDLTTPVWAWGFPFPLVPTEDDEDDMTSATVTHGIVSAHQTHDGIRYLETNATLSVGNSGGPLVDAQGRVVGINTLLIGDTTLGFALSVADYRGEIGSLLAGEIPVPPQSVTDIEFMPSTPFGQVGFGAVRCDPDAPTPDGQLAFAGLCVRATYNGFNAVVVADVAWRRDGETLCEREVVIGESVVDGITFVGCDIDDGVRLTEFTSGEYSVTFTLDSAPIGGAIRFVTVPERFKATTTGDSLPGADLDVYQFTAPQGAFVAAIVDTISLATAFDIKACLSTTPDVDGCFDRADDEIECTFPPPAFRCPQAVATLPPAPDGVYYLLVDSSLSRYAGPVGKYEVTLLSPSPIGPLELVQDNVR